ncbi:MAG: PH domain-containing protein [Ruminococcaceae bacterium]|nr:PH domain-containing protein [Oscillospiraceae bacterium]
MIDFDGKGFMARLRKVKDDDFGKIINDFLIDGEYVVGAYKSVRDGVVFTNKRIITINVQGLTGKKQDYTSLPYSKISAFSLETAGVFDMDAELTLHMSGVGRVKFEFTGNTDVKDICLQISKYALN